jgi:nucleotide-binding universal stress UspA family protein
VDTIVVGVDGSPGSDAALRWALEEARLREAVVRVVHAYQVPQTTPVDAGVGIAGPTVHPVFSVEDLERLEAAAEKEAQGVIDTSLERAGDAAKGLPTERAPLSGPAAETLIAAGREAALLVLGTRGHGGFVGLLLGSVSQQLAQHPPCPVVIMPQEK